MHTPDQNEIRVGLLREELAEAVQELVRANNAMHPYVQPEYDGTDGRDFIAMERVNRAKSRCVDLAKRIVDLES